MSTNIDRIHDEADEHPDDASKQARIYKVT
jgi:hypothetical protein